ncbi:MAG: hypothetical protein MK078_02120 [Crocinitomicaceae bacterium]|nr:hypothetical protein [Crocinitomicaceae bacterium]
MAGGKETPRQKMIGMMYLVLTALLALNVSKQIVSAFITINDKLEASNKIIDNKSGDVYFGFSQKRAALNAINGNTEKLVYWENKAITLKSKTASIVGFLLNECNDMIKESEGEDWIEEKDDDGNIIKLKPLMKISGMDNYDIPTNLFVGGNPKQPNDRGMNIIAMIHSFRDEVCAEMGTYKEGSKSYTFQAPSDVAGLQEAFKTANSKDTAKLRQFYQSLTIPEMIPSHSHDEELMPWSSVMFDHAPIVAAAALFTSLKLDVKNAEALAAEYMLAKIDAPMFKFNKIEPLPFAGASYINQGDSMNLQVLIAAIDTNNVAQIRYGIDDTIPGNWKTTTGGISLNSSSPGQHTVTGQIGVEQQGDISWKDWQFAYTVGQPMGVVSLPKLNVLYRGYPENEVLGTASGYPQDKISLKGNNCQIVQRGGKYYAEPGSGRTASITVVGRNEDGTSVNLGTMNFRVLPMPKPTIYLGQIESGSEISRNQLAAQTRLFPKYPPSVPLDASFSVVSWTLSVSGAPREAKGNGPTLSQEAKTLLRNAAVGSTVTFMTKVRYPNGDIKRRAAVYTVR